MTKKNNKKNNKIVPQKKSSRNPSPSSSDDECQKDDHKEDHKEDQKEDQKVDHKVDQKENQKDNQKDNQKEDQQEDQQEDDDSNLHEECDNCSDHDLINILNDVLNENKRERVEYSEEYDSSSESEESNDESKIKKNRQEQCNIEPNFDFLLIFKDIKDSAQKKIQTTTKKATKTIHSPEQKNKKITCSNLRCDHDDESKMQIEMPSIEYVKTINQLITLGKTYHCKKNKMFNNINLRVLFDLIEPLQELEQMIGLTDVKNKMIDQLLYFLQGYHNNVKCDVCYDCINGMTCMKNQSDMLHTVITGPPGVGKTELGKCFGKIYRKLGILTNDKFVIYSRSDLIGEYLGQTAVKTQKCIDDCEGGVMFIDEVYSLGNNEQRDHFSKECIDTINQNLSEKRNLLCIIAGYKNSINDCFFKYNEGLNRRFTFRYDIEPYKWQELKKIFELKVHLGSFSLYYDTYNLQSKDNIAVQNLFKENDKYFTCGGGDMETLFLQSKIIHSRTIINNVHTKYVLSYNDIKKGIEFLISSRTINVDEKPFGMFL